MKQLKESLIGKSNISNAGTYEKYVRYYIVITATAKDTVTLKNQGIVLHTGDFSFFVLSEKEFKRNIKNLSASGAYYECPSGMTYDEVVSEVKCTSISQMLESSKYIRHALGYFKNNL